MNIQVTQTVNSIIPAGVYEVMEQTENRVVFQLGDTAMFGFMAPNLSELIQPSEEEPTTAEEFVTNYYGLLEKKKTAPFDPQVFTFCAVNPANPLVRAYEDKLAGNLH